MKAIKILKKLTKETVAEVFYSGESTRNIIRRKKSHNLEIVIRNLPLRYIVRYFKKYGLILKVNKERGSVIFRPKENSITIEILLPRKGNRHSPYYTLLEDARSRDFTINAMYLPVRSRSKTDVIDYFGGLRDIQNKKIKTVTASRYSITVDPARILKAISLSVILHYKIDINLFYSIKSNYFLVDKLPVEDIRDELIKMLLSSRPSKCLRMLYNTGLLNIIMPELSIGVGVTQNEKYHKYDIFSHCIYACDGVKPDLILRLAALFHDIGKPQTRNEVIDRSGKIKITFYNHEVMSSKIAKKILRRLKFDLEATLKITELIYLHMYNYEPGEWTDTAVRRFIRKAKITDKDLKGLTNLPVFLLRKADRLANGYSLKAISYRQRLFEERIKKIYAKSNVLDTTDLVIDGNAIMEKFSLKPGPTIGHILNHLLSIVIEDQKMNERHILIEAASDYLSKALK